MNVTGIIRRHPRGTAVAVLLAVAVLAFGLWWFKPWRLFTDDPVNEALPGAAAAPAAEEMTTVEMVGRPDRGSTTLAEGLFISLEHQSDGRALVLETEDGSRFLRFEDFETSNGPDLVVYLSSKPATPGDWHGYERDFVDLGVLKGNVGNQNYELPGDVDLDRYGTAVVWCRRFEVGFAAATLS